MIPQNTKDNLKNRFFNPSFSQQPKPIGQPNQYPIQQPNQYPIGQPNQNLTGELNQYPIGELNQNPIGEPNQNFTGELNQYPEPIQNPIEVPETIVQSIQSSSPYSSESSFIEDTSIGPSLIEDRSNIEDPYNEETPINPILREKFDPFFIQSHRPISKKEFETKEKKQDEKRDNGKREILANILENNSIQTDTYMSKTQEKYDYWIKDFLSPFPGEILKEQKTVVHLCMYSIHLESYKPFVQYLLCLSNNLYDFPSYMYEPAEEIENQEEEWIDKFKTEFFRIFPDYLVELFISNMENYYKGIIEVEYESSLDIYLFFDISIIPLVLLQNTPIIERVISAEYILSPIHEFYNLRKICNIPINKKIEELFYKNSFLLDIREHESNSIVKYPYLLFLCERQSNLFTGAYYVNISEPTTTSYSLLLPKVADEKIGEYYFFSSKPLKTEGMVDIRRFAVFIDEDETLFFDKGAEIENLYDELPDQSYKFIYMFEDDTQLWVVKSLMHITEIL